MARNEEQENQKIAALDALVAAGPVKDPMHEPILQLGKKLGLLPEDAFAYAVELLELGIVTIVSVETTLPSESEQPFPALKVWARAEGKPASKAAKKGG